MADNYETIKCPACQNEMAKVFMPDAGIYLDVCINGCGGIYFDNREMKAFDENHENIEALEKILEGKTFIKVDESEIRKCPVCGTPMHKNFSSAKMQVQVDECYACGGKFLDNGELSKIRAEYETEQDRANDAMKLLYETVGVELKQLELDDAKRQIANRTNRGVAGLVRKLFR